MECDNVVDLEHFSEETFLSVIRSRFFRDAVYTFVGSILVAVNPYKRLDSYGPELARKAFEQCRSVEVKAMPHIFSIAATALMGLQKRSKRQTVLISGGTEIQFSITAYYHHESYQLN
jgi:myosin heavy subunit